MGELTNTYFENACYESVGVDTIIGNNGVIKTAKVDRAGCGVIPRQVSDGENELQLFMFFSFLFLSYFSRLSSQGLDLVANRTR